MSSQSIGKAEPAPTVIPIPSVSQTMCLDASHVLSLVGINNFSLCGDAMCGMDHKKQPRVCDICSAKTTQELVTLIPIDKISTYTCEYSSSISTAVVIVTELLLFFGVLIIKISQCDICFLTAIVDGLGAQKDCLDAVGTQSLSTIVKSNMVLIWSRDGSGSMSFAQ